MGRASRVRTRAAAAGIAAAALLVGLPTAAHAAPVTQVFRTGLISLEGYQTKQPELEVPSPALDGFIVGMRVQVIDRRGRVIPQTTVMLHHAVFVNRGRFDGDRVANYCAVRDREPFYGSAEEDTPLTFPAGYGYPIHNGDRWHLQAMVMNHKAPHRDVRLRYTVTTDTAPMTPVTPYWVSVACKNQRIYNVPGGGAPGGLDTRSTVWTAPKAGRIVAVAGHLHGGGERVDLREPDCGDRLLASATARYGMPDDPLYAMSPMLHEPSPRSVGIATSATGWTVRAGERIRVDSVYDNTRPHVKVMGIAHIYVAEDGASAGVLCAPLPADVADERLAFPGAPGRVEPPVVHQDISRRDARGVGRAIAFLAGRDVPEGPNAVVDVRRFRFWPPRISVAAGSRITWRFQDRQQHDVSWVEGPRGFASRYEKRGGAYTTQLTEPGTYTYFCSLHPVDMAATITVKAAGTR
jgi:plastocyanin